MASSNAGFLMGQPLNLRCLALTGTFETNSAPPACFGCVAGDFDGQGISYSALQWNFGQGTLQALLSEMNSAHADVMCRVFGDQHEQLSSVLTLPRSGQMLWARSIQTRKHTLDDQWTARFRALGESAEFQSVATRHASRLFEDGLALCRTLNLKSQRAAALLFDIKVQNGGIGPNALPLIQQDFAAIQPADPDVIEAAKLRIVANRVADCANVRWREDVRCRKLTVADGTGLVHGRRFDLAAQFGLTLAAWSGS